MCTCSVGSASLSSARRLRPGCQRRSQRQNDDGAGLADVCCRDAGCNLTPLELVDRLATLIPPLRIHRHRYYGERSRAHYLQAPLVARLYEVFPVRCVLCGAQMRIITFITELP